MLHVGPTNSGKTFRAIERLRQASRGIYLGPLRLLAWEMCDKLRADGLRVNLLTGQEQDIVEDASHASCTVEMVAGQLISRTYDVAVIDEAQLMGDPDRGSSWVRPASHYHTS